MVKDAESHADEDKNRRQSIEERNRLDAMVYEVEKNTKEWADRLDETTKERLNGAVESAKQALRSGEDSEIAKALEELSQAYSAAGASMHEAQQATPEGGASSGDGEASETTGDAKEEDVVEADYEIVDDAKT
jgi:molecular chaperone DnaK